MFSDISCEELELLDFEYSPSRHSKRFKSPDDVIRHHINFISEETDRVQKDSGLLCELNVNYGMSKDETLDIYSTPTTPADAPIFCFIHGGYWQALSKDDYAHCVRPLSGEYKIMIANYSLCPSVSLKEIVSQIKSLLQYLQQYANENDSKFITICGHSAGAHLALAGIQSTSSFEKFKHFYLISGIYDLTKLRYAESVNEKNLLGITDENVEMLSPYFQDFSRMSGLKFNFFVGGYESRSFHEQSKKMQEKLGKNSKCESKIEILEELDHFDIIDKLAFVDYEITKQILTDVKQ